MLIEKLSIGVLRVVTPVGPRYVRPPFPQRAYLVWMFRHFDTLPLKVLSRRQQRLVDELCSNRRFVPAPHGYGEEAPVLGTVDWEPVAETREEVWKRSTAALRSAVARLTSAVQNRS
jgi:hypothetical protein